mgnify:CR=1 FL=1
MRTLYLETHTVYGNQNLDGGLHPKNYLLKYFSYWITLAMKSILWATTSMPSEAGSTMHLLQEISKLD